MRQLLSGFGRWLATAAVLAVGAGTRADDVITNTITIVAAATSAPVDRERAEAEAALRAYLGAQEPAPATTPLTSTAASDTKVLNPQELVAPLRSHLDSIGARIEALDKNVSLERQQTMRIIDGSNRTLLTAVAIFAGLSLLTMVGCAVCQWRVLNRLADLFSNGIGQPYFGAMPQPPMTATAGGNLLTEATGDRLLGAIKHLEQRVNEFETSSTEPLPARVETPFAGVTAVPPPSAVPITPSVAAATNLSRAAETASSPSSAALGKGQALLNLGKADEALECFESVLVESPQDAEALLRKGMALEQMKKLDEAIDYYDRAISADRSLTRAYLCKGNVFNQQERFSEALQCYEQALRAQSAALARGA